jgi:hypothetical protein
MLIVLWARLHSLSVCGKVSFRDISCTIYPAKTALYVEGMFIAMSVSSLFLGLLGRNIGTSSNSTSESEDYIL